MTSAFTPRSTRWSRHSRAYSRTSPIGLGPYGCRAVSPTYTIDSCGSWSMTDRATVSPPNPESKIPIGASRSAAVWSGTRARLGAASGRRTESRPTSRVLVVTSREDLVGVVGDQEHQREQQLEQRDRARD